MKKTLIALAALSCAAFADTTVTFDFGRLGCETEGAINIAKNEDAYKSAVTSTGALGAMAGSYSFTQQASGGNFNNSATLTTTKENGWKNDLTTLPTGWATTFADGLTSQWNGSQGNSFTLTLSGLESGYYDLSILGGYCGKDDIAPTLKLTLFCMNEDAFVNTVIAGKDLGGTNTVDDNGGLANLTLTNGNSNEGYTFDASKIFVGSEGFLSIAIKGLAADGTSNPANGTRTPLNGIKLTLVPEPATATLSLLALAGLAARRRRH